jgi:site-specific recombinase XerD
MTGDQARAAWLAWLEAERRASPHTLEAYGADSAEFLGFLTRHLGQEPDLAAQMEKATAQAFYAELKSLVAAEGRDPSKVPDALRIAKAFAGGRVGE